VNWIRWQLYRLWIGCQEPECTYYWTRPSRLGEWHEFIHQSLLEKREWPHYGMVTEAGKRWAKRHGIYQYVVGP
jgi:hypothetical protein